MERLSAGDAWLFPIVSGFCQGGSIVIVDIISLGQWC